MTEADLFAAVRDANVQIAALYAQVISMNFAMVVAIYYFLNQSKIMMKLLGFLIYLVGMFMFVGLMLEESNIKRVALDSLAALPDISQPARGLLALQGSWLFHATSVFLNLGLWVLILAISFLLFVWRRPAAKS